MFRYIKQTIKTCCLATVLAAGFCTSASAEKADSLWYVQTDLGYSIAADSVSYFAAADDDQFFSIITKAGTVISLNQKAVFVKKALTAVAAVKAMPEEPKMMVVRNTLHITGMKHPQEARIFNVNGKLIRRDALQTGSSDIDVNDLPHGSYILRVAHSSLKFMKY